MMKMKLRATGGEAPANGTESPPLDKESVFEWFGLHLNPAGRVELLCGLLHMCQPLELRFLGSCLEDLARRDFAVLREFETRANCPADLEGLADVSDPVVLSKLLVYVSLLGSKSRECAGLLFGTLGRVEAAVCGVLPETLDQLRLLFTMGSLHPAFSFHQREEIRTQLDRIQDWSQFSRPRFLCPHQENKVDWTLCNDPNPHLSSRSQREVVHIEKIILKEVSVAADSRQYTFEVKWSDSSLTSITKSHCELEDFLLKLPKEKSLDGFEKTIVRLLSRADQCEVRELERNLREKFLSLSPDVLQRCDVSAFFLSDPSLLPCSRCTRAPVSRIHQPARGFSEDCSETSSLEETDVERYSIRAPGMSNPHSEGQRRANCEQNGERVWMKDTELEQSSTNDRRILTPGQKSKGRSAGKRERSRRANSAKNSTGIQKPSATLMSNPTTCKDAARVRYGDTSSESSNSVPSSPVHHKSLDEQDTESQSDNSAQEPEKTPPAKGVGGKAVAMVNPLVAEHQNVLQQPSAPFELALSACLPYALQYNPTQRDSGEGNITITIPLARDPVTSSASTHPQQQPPLGAFSVLSGVQCPLQPATSTANNPIKINTKAATLPGPSSSAGSSCQVPGPCPTTVPTHTPGPGPLPPPAVTHSTAPSDLLSYINSSNPPVTAQTQTGPTQQQQQGGCNACGCRGSCGGNVPHQSLGYFLPPQPTRQMFGPPPPFFHLTASSFPAQGHQNNGTPLPFFAHTGPPTAFLHAPSDHMLASQTGYSLPQMPAFRRFYQPQPIFPPVGLMSSGNNVKKTANVSCYNCGMSGHYAQDCKQPSIDGGLTGGFRLKYVGPNSSGSLDKND